MLRFGGNRVCFVCSNPLSASGGGLGRDISQPDLHQKPPPQMGLPRSEGLPRIDRPARSEGVTRYNSGQPEDPYRAPPRERENIRMQGSVVYSVSQSVSCLVSR